MLRSMPSCSIMVLLLLVLPVRAEPRPTAQIAIPRVDCMPDLPQPLEMRDWRRTAVAFDKLVFDSDARGEYLPLIWADPERINFDLPGFGLPSYVGDPRWGRQHEAVACIGAVLGATLVGIDKSNQDSHDYVRACLQYFNRANGEDVVLNNTRAHSRGSFWYRLWPAMSFCMLADRYPEIEELEACMRTMADRWCIAAQTMRGDFDHLGFDLLRGETVDNGRWTEPDGAAGIAWIEYMAWQRFGDPKYLDAAKMCMEFLDRRDAQDGPYYEVLMPYGAYLAARMNAELGLDYDVEKMVNWCFDGTHSCRNGWGVMAERWGDHDCHGLVGQTRTGYAFAMNTFAQVGALVPLVRYDPRYARVIGKWTLHAANAARLFYADAHPADRQTNAPWQGDPQCAIPYEGLRRDLRGGKFEVFEDSLAPRGPYALGDRIKQGAGPTDFAIYGGAYVGMLGAVVHETNIPGILRIDCLATDFFRSSAPAIYLYFSPYDTPQDVEIEVASPADLYDDVSERFLARNAHDRTTVRIPAGSAIRITLIPTHGRREGVTDE